MILISNPAFLPNKIKYNEYLNIFIFTINISIYNFLSHNRTCVYHRN
jgi:hypothetical protein